MFLNFILKLLPTLCINFYSLLILKSIFPTLICGSSEDPIYTFVRLSVCVIIAVKYCPPPFT